MRELFKVIKRIEEAMEKMEEEGFQPQMVFLLRKGDTKFAVALDGSEGLAERLFAMAAERGRLRGLGTFELREVEEGLVRTFGEGDLWHLDRGSTSHRRSTV